MQATVHLEMSGAVQSKRCARHALLWSSLSQTTDEVHDDELVPLTGGLVPTTVATLLAVPVAYATLIQLR